MNKSRAPFRKFKDSHSKQSYSKRLAKSIKRRAVKRSNLTSKPRRQLDFQAKSMKQQQQQQNLRILLPKTNFSRNNMQPSGSRSWLNSTIEDGEIIEEIESSDDDDDCIVVEPEVTSICLDDDSHDVPATQQTTDCDENDNIPSCSRFEVDTKSEKKLFDVWSKIPGRGPMYPLSASSKTSANDSCITIDDSFYNDSPVTITDDRQNPNKYTKKQTQQQSAKKQFDDSVIFIEENFIPLLKEDEQKGTQTKNNNKFERKNLRMKGKNPEEMVITPQKMCMSSSLFTSTERKKLAEYNSNTYNPNNETANRPLSNKRAIILDGSNVAFSHGCSNNFSSEGIKYCIDYFEKMGHEVKAVIPLFRRNETKSTNPGILDKLFKEKKIVFTPCKNLPQQQSISYDDRFILQLAYQMNAAVVSNDNYRDLIMENPAFKKIIENRVIGYSWCNDIFILPKDPYGRFGPQLDEILRC